MTNRETAKIYQFPIRVRGTTSTRQESLRKPADPASARFAHAECGSGWYHEAALQEAEQTRNR